MAQIVFTLFVIALVLAGCSVVAIVTTTAFQRILQLEAALGLSMLLMGVVLYLVFPDTGGPVVVALVGLAHGVAGGLIWYRRKLQDR